MGRFVLSKTHDWELVHDDQDIRGWPVQDRADQKLGTVAELIANTENELVESIVLDNGKEFPAREVKLGDGVVYLKADAALATDADPVVRTYDNTRIRTRGANGTEGFAAYENTCRRHYDDTFATTGQSYDAYRPAYLWGFTYGTHKDYRDRDYVDVEPEMRSRYETEHGEGTWERVKDAVRHAFDHSRSHRYN